MAIWYMNLENEEETMKEITLLYPNGTNGTVYHTYHGVDNYKERTAVVRKNEKGFLVDLFSGNELWETRKVYNHSESYAEDVGENYVLGVIEPKQSNEASILNTRGKL